MDEKKENNSESYRGNDFFIKSPAIELPKGGGAIRGIDETFSVNSSDGSAIQSIPIFVSPSRGFSPQLSISYDSNAGNGVFGFGWNLSLPAVSRKTNKGFPKYGDAVGNPKRDTDVFILSGAEDLVPDSRGSPANNLDYTVDAYCPRVEGLFARIERWTHVSTKVTHWRSFSRDNILTIYGGRDSARISDPSDKTKIFKWLVSESFDDKGNAIVYHYKKENLKGVDIRQPSESNHTEESISGNTYLERIQYCNKDSVDRIKAVANLDNWLLEDVKWCMELRFDYGVEELTESPDHIDNDNWSVREDPFSKYIAGFEQRTYRLCKRILMFHNFEGDSGGIDQNGNRVLNYLTRSTNFIYNEKSNNEQKCIASYLTSSTQIAFEKDGDGKYQQASFPPIEYQYSKVVLPDQLDQISQQLNKKHNSAKIKEIGSIKTLDKESLENLPIGIENKLYQWVDLDGEGLSGVLYHDQDAWYYKANQGNAKFAPMRRINEIPSTAQPQTFQLADLVGNGVIDVVQRTGEVQGFYERKVDETSDGWSNFHSFQSIPNIDWSNPNQRLVDLTGDGHADILVTEDDIFIWYESKAQEGYGEAKKIQKAIDENSGPTLVLADGTESIYLADFSGDGLTDLVRIRNGEVCYWPNLGYGKFGAKVTMDSPPFFDHSDNFNQQRIQLSDIDGSGTADIIYLGKEGISIWLNQSGNSWSKKHSLCPFLRIDNYKTVSVFDLLGDGTACLVWSSPLPEDSNTPLRYVKLMPFGKPHLLTQVSNNLGAETNIEYAASTKFYLQDKAAGTPWITKIPFPIHVVEKVVIKDKWRKSTFSTSYSYHHGYFEGIEREFRGFGRVEQVDSESFQEFAENNVDSNITTSDQELYQPPVKTITWYHTGAVVDRSKILSHYEGEYFPNNFNRVSNDFTEAKLPEATFHLQEPDQELSPEEWCEGLRACKGMVLRQEVYELDERALKKIPSEHKPVKLFTTAFHNCQIQRVQAKGSNKHAVFLATESEAITYHYELNLTGEKLNPDPRVTHSLNLKTDEMGNVLESVAIAYPRVNDIEKQELLKEFLEAIKVNNSNDLDEIRAVQNEQYIIYTQNNFTNDINEISHYRTRVGYETKTYEVTGIKPRGTWFTLAELLDQDLARIDTLEYHKPDITKRQEKKRIIEHVRSKFFDEEKEELKEPLEYGELSPRALPYETYKLALTENLLKTVFAEKLDEGNSRELLNSQQSGYFKEGEKYWIRSGIAGFNNDAKEQFYLPEKYADAFGAETTLNYDPHNLYIQSSTDAVGNTSEVTQFDYRLLAPIELKDINDNLSEARYDIRGLPTLTALKGKGDEADDLGLTTTNNLNPTEEELTDFFIAPKEYDESKAKEWLGSATTRTLYYFGEQTIEGKTVWGKFPSCACGITREQHVKTPISTNGNNQQNRLQAAFEYSDGLGAVIVKKIQAEPAPEDSNSLSQLRWIASGKVILNNKGKPVKQYEPYFVENDVDGNNYGHRFEEPKQIGVSPTLYYDTLDRVIRTEYSDGSLTRTTINPWYVENWDQNDTVLESHWKEKQTSGAAKKALELAINHAETPNRVFLDSLGREVISIEHNRTPQKDETIKPWNNAYYTTITTLDAEGKPLWITDARKNRVMQYVFPPHAHRGTLSRGEEYSPSYDIAGNLLFQHSMDAGDRWMLPDATGQPLIEWDYNERELPAETGIGEKRKEHRRYVTQYDALRRPTEQWLYITDVTDGTQNITSKALIEKLVYGDDKEAISVADAKEANLRGQLYQHWDSSGKLENQRFDFKGNLTNIARQLVKQYQVPVIDWAENDTNQTNELEQEVFEQITEYDAHNRIARIYNWHSQKERVAIYEPKYNVRGALFSEDLIIKAKLNESGYTHRAEHKTLAIKAIHYDAKGQKTYIEKGNGTITRYQYEEDTYRLLQMRTIRPEKDKQYPFPAFHANLNNQHTFQQLNYTYDPIGNITEIYDEAWKPVFFKGTKVLPKDTYVYDALYRLVKATGRENASNSAAIETNNEPVVVNQFPVDDTTLTGYTQYCIYDEVGNFKKMIHQSNRQTKWQRTYQTSSDSNRLLETKVSGQPAVKYQYDTHGSMLNLKKTEDEFNIHWDANDMIFHINLQAGGNRQVWYNYQSDKQRTRKVIINKTSNEIQERIYLGGYEVFRKWDDGIGGELKEEVETHHLFAEDERVLLVEDVIKASEEDEKNIHYRYQYGNHLGSVGSELNKDASVIVSYEEFFPYGTSALKLHRGKIKKRYCFTGMEKDHESQLSYHSARYFNPSLSRWISSDPIFISGGSNLYRYAKCNPNFYTDKNGKTPTVSIDAPVLESGVFAVPEELDLVTKEEAVRYFKSITFGGSVTIKTKGKTLVKPFQFKFTNIDVDRREGIWVITQIHKIEYSPMEKKNKENKTSENPKSKKKKGSSAKSQTDTSKAPIRQKKEVPDIDLDNLRETSKEISGKAQIVDAIMDTYDAATKGTYYLAKGISKISTQLLGHIDHYAKEINRFGKATDLPKGFGMLGVAVEAASMFTGIYEDANKFSDGDINMTQYVIRSAGHVGKFGASIIPFSDLLLDPVFQKIEEFSNTPSSPSEKDKTQWSDILTPEGMRKASGAAPF